MQVHWPLRRVRAQPNCVTGSLRFFPFRLRFFCVRLNRPRWNFMLESVAIFFFFCLPLSLSPSTPPSTPNFNGIHWRCGFITAGILLPDAPILLLPIDGRLSLVPSFVKPSLSFVIRSVIFPIFPPQSTESKRIPRKNLWIQCAKSEGILPKKKKFNSINK